MRRCCSIALLLLGGCQTTESSGSLFTPVAVQPPAPVVAPVPVAPAPEFDLDSDARVDEEAVADTDAPLTPEEVADGLGITEPPVEDDAVAEVEPEVIAVVVPPPAPAPEPLPPEAHTWAAGKPLDPSFGVRLVSTTSEAQPPRAILGLPDGTEKVVSPGTFLPEARIVVLAVGRDVVQVALITPAGDYAKVETRELTAMYRRPAPER